MTEVSPGIHQLQIPIPNNPLEYTNIYLLQGDEGYLLIDTGWNSEEAFQSLKRQMAEIGVDLKDITQIIATHVHGDHYGLVGRLKQHTPARVSIHYLEKAQLETRYTSMEATMRQIEEWFHGNGAPADEFHMPRMRPGAMPGRMEPVLPDVTLRGDEIISAGAFTLQVVWTPGHSPGHICLYEPALKILFAGDHVLPVITPNISLQPQSADNPLGDFIDSLNRVKQLDVSLVLPAHEKIFNDLQSRVDEIIRHHQHRNSEILEALKTEPKTAYQISAKITWMPELGGVRFQDLHPMERRMAVLETLAHLEAMTVEGKLDKFHRNSIIYYQLTL